MEGESNEAEHRSVTLHGAFDTIERNVTAKAIVNVLAHLSGDKRLGRIGCLRRWLEKGAVASGLQG